VVQAACGGEETVMTRRAAPGREHDARGQGLKAPGPATLVAVRAGHRGCRPDKAQRFLVFRDRIDHERLRHRIITANRYTDWFRRGEQTPDQVRAFIVQFSVFSNQSLVAQLHKQINAESLEILRASKEILANEIGVVFRLGRPRGPARAAGPAGRASGRASLDDGVLSGGMVSRGAAMRSCTPRTTPQSGGDRPHERSDSEPRPPDPERSLPGLSAPRAHLLRRPDRASRLFP